MSNALHSFWWIGLAMLAIAWASYNLSLAARGRSRPFFAQPKDFSRFEKLSGNRETFDQVLERAVSELRKRKLIRYLPALVFLLGTAVTLTITAHVSPILYDTTASHYDTVIGGIVLLVGLSLANLAARKLEANLLATYISGILSSAARSSGNE